MSTLRISDAPLLPDVEGTEKIPTGGRGDYAISVDQIKGHIFQDVDKELVGLGNVDNTSDLDKPVSTAQQAALNLKADKTNVYTRSETSLALSKKADLVNGIIPENQIPSSFNDVLEFTTPNLPIVGEIGKIYVTTDTNKTWRWTTNKYVEISGWNPDSVSKRVTIPTYNNAVDGVVPVTGVADGAYFNVRSSDDESYVDEYQNVGGSAVATGKRYLSALGVQLQEKAASTIKDESGKSQQEINSTLLRDTYYALNEGFKTDDSANDAAWVALQAKLKAGDTVIFNAGTYTFSGNMNIEKIINIVGTGRIRGTKAILKFNSGGVVRKTAGIDIRDINIAGTQTTTVFDFDNRVFGNIGLKEQYDGISDTSTGRLNSVTITGFDVGRVTAQEGTAIWAGAYRDNTDVVIQRNRVGYVALDGATHEKYVGGTISANTEIGIWAEAKTHNYNNIDLIGTTLEINGLAPSNYNSRDVLKSLNVFAGKNTIINFIGSYNENVLTIAKDGGVINKIGSYEHRNSYSFASDASLNFVLSGGTYQSEFKTDKRLEQLISSRINCSVSDVSKNLISITSSSSAQVTVVSKKIKVDSIKVGNIRAIRAKFRYKFKSGFTANSELNVQPSFVLRDKAGNTDTQNTSTSYPKQLLLNSFNEWHSFDFSYRPRITSGYLNPDELFDDLDFRLALFNSTSGSTNFSTDNLVLEISEIEITVIAEQSVDVSLAYKTAGTSSDRPVGLLQSDAGLMFFNTTANVQEFWDGTAWQNVRDRAVLVTGTTTVLANAAASINTSNKTAGGRFVFATDNGKMYYPVGSTPTAAWRPTDGSGDITPV